MKTLTNRWPTEEVAATVPTWYGCVAGLGKRLTDAIAEVLPEPQAAVLAAIDGGHHTSNLVAAYHGPSTSRGETTMVAAHSDTALLTFIRYGTSGMAGLEIKNKAGQWLRVDSSGWPTDGLLVNVGDTLARVTEGRLDPTPHRVWQRKAAGLPMEARLALIFFYAQRCVSRL
jgi:isopenicillin N synthase-like dioxygenase